MSEHTVEWARHAVEVERIDERCCELNFPVIEEATELFLGAPCSMRGLLLVCAERNQLPMGGEYFLHHIGAETTNQFVLQIRFAYVESEAFHVGASEVVTEAGPLKSKPEVALFSCVTETGQPSARSLMAVDPQEAADCLCAADRHNGNALGNEIPSTTRSEGLQGDLVADAFDQHDRARLLGHGISDKAHPPSIA
jgi:hypothetical protein